MHVTGEITSTEINMAKKRAFPTKQCPNCGKPIHAAAKSHPACGWTMNGNTATAVVTRRRPKKAASKSGAGGVTMQDIESVKALVDRMGAVKVQELARVLG